MTRTAVLGLLVATRAFADPPPTIEQRLERVEERQVLAELRADPPLAITTQWPHRGGPRFEVHERGSEVDRDDLYHLLGRDDLADAYAQRLAIGRWATGGGLVAMIGGGLAAAALKTSSPGLEVGALVIACAGFGSTLVGVHYLRNPDPVSPDEARALVDDYNDRAAAAELAQWKLSVAGRF